ncbi:MAG: hypothetical protein M0R03_23365 [Novosphingobium sp.]|nr:hypothetical protein [Novosphingobium sp.]
MYNLTISEAINKVLSNGELECNNSYNNVKKLYDKENDSGKNTKKLDDLEYNRVMKRKIDNGEILVRFDCLNLDYDYYHLHPKNIDTDKIKCYLRLPVSQSFKDLFELFTDELKKNTPQFLFFKKLPNNDNCEFEFGEIDIKIPSKKTSFFNIKFYEFKTQEKAKEFYDLNKKKYSLTVSYLSIDIDSEKSKKYGLCGYVYSDKEITPDNYRENPHRYFANYKNYVLVCNCNDGLNGTYIETHWIDVLDLFK